MKKSLLFPLACLLLAGCLFLSGCGKRSDLTRAQELNVAVAFYPTTMDAQMKISTDAMQYLDPICGRLFRPDPEKGYVPELAESFEISEDGCTYTFRLREGIRYSNGEPIDAGDFVDSFRRIADPITASSAVYILQDLCQMKNVEEVNAGTMETDRLGIHALDERTLVMELQQPCPYLPYVLTMPPCAPFNRAFAAECGRDYATSPETLLSSGPFIVDRFEPLAMQVHYVKNPYYIDADQVKLSGITVRQVSNKQQAIMSYQTGDADAIATNGEYAVLSQGDPCLVEIPGATIEMIGGNYERCKAWQNKNIRMALSFALDRDGIVNGFLRTGYKPITRLIPSQFSMEEDGEDFAADPARYSAICAFDPQRAKTCWENGLEELGVKTLELEYLMVSSEQQLVEILKDRWEKTLPGLTLKPRMVSSEQYYDLTTKGEFDLTSLGWAADYPDPNAFFSIFASRSPMNFSKYANANFDRLLQQGALETDPARRFDLLHQMEDVFMDDLGAIPFCTHGGAYLISERVKGVFIDFSGNLLLYAFAEKEAES